MERELCEGERPRFRRRLGVLEIEREFLDSVERKFWSLCHLSFLVLVLASPLYYPAQ